MQSILGTKIWRKKNRKRLMKISGLQNALD